MNSKYPFNEDALFNFSSTLVLEFILPTIIFDNVGVIIFDDSISFDIIFNISPAVRALYSTFQLNATLFSVSL